MFTRFQMKYKSSGKINSTEANSPALGSLENMHLSKQEDSILKDDPLVQSMDGKIPKRKLKLKMIKPKDDSGKNLRTF